MAVSTPHQYPVHLSEEQRERLSKISRNGQAPVKKVRHAQVLLLSDRDRDGGPLSRTEIAGALGLHVNSVDRIRKRFVLEGEQPALERKVRESPPVPAKIDGRVEAHLVAICCGPAPEGRTRWTLRLIAEELTRRGLVTEVSAETVRRTLKKTNCSLGGRSAGAFSNGTRPASSPRWNRFVAQMEDVLDVYTAEHSEAEPLIAMDEASKQLLRDEAEPLPMAPGRPACEDYHYERRGVQALFLFFDPLRGWRRVSCRDSRTRTDWAEEIRRLLIEDYPHARKVKLVCDNLNTHSIASLYHAFPPEEAHALARRLEIHYTPRNGSWLNVAEIELSVLARQCLDRRIDSPDELAGETTAWGDARNADGSRVHWRLTTVDARAKLQHLYPQT